MFYIHQVRVHVVHLLRPATHPGPRTHTLKPHVSIHPVIPPNLAHTHTPHTHNWGRPPLERIISYYYFYFKYYGRRYRDKVLPSIQEMEPRAALHSLTHQGADKFYYHHMPILVLFGNLGAAGVVVRAED